MPAFVFDLIHSRRIEVLHVMNSRIGFELLPVLGSLPRDESQATPSRHLGLVTAAERDGSERLVERLGEQVARHLDLDGLLALARTAEDLPSEPWDPAREVTARTGSRPRVAVAGGRAFTFRYAETDELLRAAGCEVVTFDPLTDPTLPAGTQAVYLGGGFPEVHAAELSANHSLLRDLRLAVESGVPTVAECAGLLYLARTLDGSPMAGAVDAEAAMSERLTLRYPVATAPADSLLARAGEQVTGHEFHRTRTSPVAEGDGAWVVDGAATGFATPTTHASYLHVHWAGHPRLAQRFADAAHAATPHVPHAVPEPVAEPVSGDHGPVDPLRHHGDREVGPGLLDLAVNVYAGARPAWLDRALHAAIDDAASYPDARPAAEALAHHVGRPTGDVLPTAGAAEAFTLVARLRAWQRPVVVHPQFTEPQAALEATGHRVTEVLCRAEDGFVLRPGSVPADADLVVVGNPTNPTGVLHPRETIAALRRPGRLVVVDEAFMDAVPDEPESLVGEASEDVLVVRSLTKQWSVPGIRAGFVVGGPALVEELVRLQTPWSVSGPAVAAIVACCSGEARAESAARAYRLDAWRAHLEAGLRDRGLEHVASAAPFVLVRLGRGAREALREHGVAVRRGDTFPGLDPSWVRVAVRPPATTDRFLAVLDELLVTT
jgi:cobyrinic acid a,c-diamide synthase